MCSNLIPFFKRYWPPLNHHWLRCSKCFFHLGRTTHEVGAKPHKLQAWWIGSVVNGNPCLLNAFHILHSDVGEGSSWISQSALHTPLLVLTLQRVRLPSPCVIPLFLFNPLLTIAESMLSLVHHCSDVRLISIPPCCNYLLCFFIVWIIMLWINGDRLFECTHLMPWD